MAHTFINVQFDLRLTDMPLISVQWIADPDSPKGEVVLQDDAARRVLADIRKQLERALSRELDALATRSATPEHEIEALTRAARAERKARDMERAAETAKKEAAEAERRLQELRARAKKEEEEIEAQLAAKKAALSDESTTASKKN